MLCVLLDGPFRYFVLSSDKVRLLPSSHLKKVSFLETRANIKCSSGGCFDMMRPVFTIL